MNIQRKKKLEQLWEIRQYQNTENMPLAAKVNNNLYPLSHEVEEEAEITFLDITDNDGRRIYMTSLTFLFTRAAREILDGAIVIVKHSLQNGIYFDIKYKETLKSTHVRLIEKRMRQLVEENVLIERISYTREEAIKRLQEDKLSSNNSQLLRYKDSCMTHIYRCGWLQDYYYGYMVPSTGYLKVFSLHLYNHGIVLLGPSEKNPNKPTGFIPQPKLFQVYKNASEWGKIMGISNVHEWNCAIQSGEYREIVRVTEAAHEKKICEIADMILNNREKGRIILIAGPSSSGKTSFAHRLELQLKVNGLSPITISMDNYFVDREETPLDEHGEPDFETVDAVDITLFNRQMAEIIAGEEVVLPTFDFVTGKKYFDPTNKIQVEEKQPIILEGIHGLNPKLTNQIPDGNKFRIYVSPLTQMNLDSHNKISTSDLRLIRRMARDTQTRGKTPQAVIEAFDKLKKAEQKYIFPYQENADVMFNSALIYELSVLKKFVYPMLQSIDCNSEVYSETRRLEKFLQFFDEMELEIDIPPTSLVREFIGGSTLV